MGSTSRSRRLPGDGLRPAAAFVLVALGWTWTLGFTAAALDAQAGHPLHLLALPGPLVGWVWAVRGLMPAGSMRPFLRRVLDPRALSASTWAGILFVGCAPALVAAVMVGATGGWAAIGLGLTWQAFGGAVLFALAAGLVEEPGWRGVAQDGFAARHHWVVTALVLGVLWSSWHLPLYLIEGTYQHGLGMGTEAFWLSMAIRVPLAVLLVWVVRLGGGAVVAAVLAHALGNTLGELLDVPIRGMWWELAVSCTAAVVVIAVGARRDRSSAR